MKRQGRRKEQYDIKEVVEAAYKYGGIVIDVAEHMKCSRQTIYRYIDEHPDVKEAFESATEDLENYEIESAYKVIGKCMQKVDDDPNVALKAATTILTKGKKSRYYTEPPSSKGNVTNVYGGHVASAKEQIQQSKNA